MKKLLIILSIIFSFTAKAQLCETFDTVRNNSVSLITYNSARINGTITHIAPGQIVTLLLKYVRTGFTDTVTASGTTPIRNIVGLSAGTAYRYYYSTVCPSGSVNQQGIYTFTTLQSTVVYTPMTAQGYQYKYVKVDSGFIVPRSDTGLNKSPNIGGQIKFRPADSTFYGYDGRIWKPLAIDSSGIIALLNNKVDSVTVSGDSLWYWKQGVSYGYILPINLLAWKTNGNASTSPGTNFIGTTDSVNLELRANNIRSGFIDINDLNTAFGHKALLNFTTGVGVNNTAFGFRALTKVTIGNFNDAFGVDAQHNNISGNNNTAVGNDALYYNISGSDNISIGYNSMYNSSTGGRNVAIGKSSGYSNTSGGNNIFLGSSAGQWTSGSDNLFIGSYDNGFGNDTIKSIIYGKQNTTPGSARLRFNAQVYTPYFTNLSTQDRLIGQFSTSGQHGYITLGTNLSIGAGVLNAASTTSLPLSSLTAATVPNSIDNGSHNQIWSWSGPFLQGLTLNYAGTGSGVNSEMLQILKSGTHSSSGLTSYGMTVTNSQTGTSSTTIASRFEATNGETSNISVWAARGSLNLGTVGTESGVLKFNGATSGIVTIQPAAAAGTWTMTLPTTDGAANEFLQTNGNGVTTWATPSGGSGITVGTTTITSGTTTRVPFNDAGVYNEDAGLTYNKTTDILSVAAGLTVTTTTGGGLVMNLGGGSSMGRLSSLGTAVPNWMGTFINSSFNGAGWILDNTATEGGFYKLDTRGGNGNQGIGFWKIPSGAGTHTDESEMMYMSFSTGNVNVSNKLYIGPNTVTPTAALHIKAGTTALQPLRFTSGPLATTTAIIAGGVEFLTDKFYGTITTGPLQKEFTMNDVALTSGTVPVATTNGRLTNGLIISSGAYTPTLTNVTNVTASTAYECQYLRVGNTVTVSGKVDIDVTIGAASELGMSLPIASAMTAEQNLGGTGSSAAAASLVSAVRADFTNDRAAFVFTAVSLTNDSYFFEFTYQIK